MGITHTNFALVANALEAGFKGVFLPGEVATTKRNEFVDLLREMQVAIMCESQGGTGVDQRRARNYKAALEGLADRLSS